jgi:hypothetical protein
MCITVGFSINLLVMPIEKERSVACSLEIISQISQPFSSVFLSQKTSQIS